MQPKILAYTLQIVCVALFFLFSPIAYSKISVIDDWVLSDNICGGCYQPDPLPTKPAKSLEITANSADLTKTGNSLLHGNVRAYYENMWLRSQRAEVERSGKQFTTLRLFDKVSLQQPGFRIDTNRALMNLLSKDTWLGSIEYRLYSQHARGAGESAALAQQNLLTVANASYTTCAPNNNGWLVKTNKLILNRESGMAQAYNAKLYVQNIPVFYWPYISLPIDKRRKSGFLQPSIGSSSIHGKSIAIPLYLNLASNYDWLINMQFMSHHGMKFDNQLRYIDHHVKKLEINYDFLPYDRQAEKYRSWVKITNATNVTDDLKLNVNYANSNDHNYYADFQPEAANSLYALQQAHLEYTTKHYSLTTEVLQHKLFNSYTEIPHAPQYRKLPEITLNILPIWLDNFMVSGAVQHTSFENFSGQNLPTAMRYYGKINLAQHTKIGAFNLQPGLSLNYVAYQRNQQTSKQFLTPVLDLQADLSFMRFSAQNMRTLQPKLYYVYIPKVKKNTTFIFDTKVATFNYHQMFRSSKYYGVDQFDATNSLTMALESRKLHAGQQSDMLGVGVRYDHLVRKFSALTATYEYTFNTQTKFFTDIVFNNLYSVNLQHKLATNYVFNIGYAYDTQLTNLPLHQANVSLAVPVTNNLDALARVEYDFKNRHLVNTAVGLEYQTCCFAFRLLSERVWQPNMPNIHEYDKQFKFQVIFKGLAGVGTADNKHVSGLVPGYSYQDKW